jgi:YggT family protein
MAQAPHRRNWRHRFGGNCKSLAEALPLSVCTGPNTNDEGQMIELLGFLSYLISLYTWVVIADVVLSWLMQLNIVNPYQPTVRSISQLLHSVTEPLLRPIRQMLPRASGIDFSPFVLLLACYFVQSVVLPNLAKLF